MSLTDISPALKADVSISAIVYRKNKLMQDGAIIVQFLNLSKEIKGLAVTNQLKNCAGIEFLSEGKSKVELVLFLGVDTKTLASMIQSEMESQGCSTILVVQDFNESRE